MTVAATTELEAINVMLSAVGEAPINSLTGTLPVDARQAQSFLNEASKEIQSEGWSFNYEYDVVLTRDAGNSIALPTSALRVDVSVANHPDIDPKRIGIMGWSLGGSTAFYSAWEPMIEALSANGERFAAHLPLYPGTLLKPDDNRWSNAPMHILFGEDDDYTPLSCLLYTSPSPRD